MRDGQHIYPRHAVQAAWSGSFVGSGWVGGRKVTNVRRRSGGQPARCAVCGFDSHTASYTSGSAGSKAPWLVLEDGADMVSSGSPQVIETVSETVGEINALICS